jgi:hypothetical protein
LFRGYHRLTLFILAAGMVCNFVLFQPQDSFATSNILEIYIKRAFYFFSLKK